MIGNSIDIFGEFKARCGRIHALEIDYRDIIQVLLFLVNASVNYYEM
jgi:hypothetical protein